MITCLQQVIGDKLKTPVDCLYLPVGDLDLCGSLFQALEDFLLHRRQKIQKHLVGRLSNQAFKSLILTVILCAFSVRTARAATFFV